jgi:AcrR family transcriptional regulator
LLDAAAKLFTEGAVYSVRSVAAEAGVNHGQVHHLFGGKEGMTQAMFEDLGRQLLARIESRVSGRDAPEFLNAAAAALIEDDRFARGLARQVTESPSSAPVQREFPVVEAMLDHLDGLGPDARALLAEGLARSLGWALFAPWIRRATGLDESQAQAIESRLGGPPLEGSDG